MCNLHQFAIIGLTKLRSTANDFEVMKSASWWAWIRHLFRLWHSAQLMVLERWIFLDISWKHTWTSISKPKQPQVLEGLNWSVEICTPEIYWNLGTWIWSTCKAGKPQARNVACLGWTDQQVGLDAAIPGTQVERRVGSLDAQSISSQGRDTQQKWTSFGKAFNHLRHWVDFSKVYASTLSVWNMWTWTVVIWTEYELLFSVHLSTVHFDVDQPVVSGSLAASSIRGGKCQRLPAGKRLWLHCFLAMFKVSIILNVLIMFHCILITWGLVVGMDFFLASPAQRPISSSRVWHRAKKGAPHSQPDWMGLRRHFPPQERGWKEWSDQGEQGDLFHSGAMRVGAEAS